MNIMSPTTIAIKVDVDTYVGTRDGVPRLLKIMESAGIKATFYFSMGPDNSGKAIRRIFTQKGFLKKILLSGVTSAYDLKTMLYGTILPPPLIGSSFPEIIRKTSAMGHETGIHCWDHVKWHDLLPWLPKRTVAMEFGRAFSLYEELIGQRPKTTATPGWTVSADSLEIQDALSLSYCSDCRGKSPFYPIFNDRRYETLQIPTTWATMADLLGEKDITADNINDYYLSCLTPGLNVHNIHAEMEGGVMEHQFVDLLDRLKKLEVRFITLAEAAEEYAVNAAESPLVMGQFPGHPGLVALQK